MCSYKGMTYENGDEICKPDDDGKIVCQVCTDSGWKTVEDKVCEPAHDLGTPCK